MGHLNGTSCYLVGPIEHDENSGCKWRADISAFLTPLGVKIYNPLDRPRWIQKIIPFTQPNQTREMILENIDANDDERWRKAQTLIRKTCQRYVATCDFLICFLNSSRTYGTIEELVLASNMMKPILCVLDGQMPSLWLWDILKSEYIFESFDDLKQFLMMIDTGNDKICLNALKWVFLGDDCDYKSITWEEI